MISQQVIVEQILDNFNRINQKRLFIPVKSEDVRLIQKTFCKARINLGLEFTRRNSHTTKQNKASCQN